MLPTKDFYMKSGKSFEETYNLLKNLSYLNENWSEIEEHLNNGGKSWDICKHLINLIEGIPKAKIWRNQISNKSINKELEIEYLLKMTTRLQEMGY